MQQCSPDLRKILEQPALHPIHQPAWTIPRSLHSGLQFSQPSRPSWLAMRPSGTPPQASAPASSTCNAPRPGLGMAGPLPFSSHLLSGAFLDPLNLKKPPNHFL